MGRGEAPGRINLIGEHTDYNEGFVLPAVLPRRVSVDVRARNDDLVRATSEGFPSIAFSLRDEDRAGGWADHVRGVTWALRNAAHKLRGYEATISTRLPAGAGLGSSAALEVALLRALRDEFALAIDDRALAMLAHRSESEFVGARVGTMDQLAASLGREGEALFIDTRTNEIERVPLPAELGLIVIDSGIAHQHATGGYNDRRNECEDAARHLGLRALRDATEADVARLAVTAPHLAARARHVVTENARVRWFLEALRRDDLARCGQLLDASHRSLRDDFAVSIPEIDALAELLRAQPGVLGARIVGGGFGGAVLAIARPDVTVTAARTAADAYRKRIGREARVVIS
ncbi:MAG: galactokinase [Chloroflexi bacterium 13_1_40CM_4_68_4]|nr:MAG: galactokinase [Chloroflexi bacterium 13_1_40CM_4_68_4]